MNERVLKILKSPELLRSSDREELKREIANYPYVQPLRALYLLSLHKFAPELYSKELAITAAYTTDKKILFNLVNPTLPKKAPKKEEISQPIQEESATKVSEKPTEEIEKPTAPAKVKMENIAVVEEVAATIETQEKEIASQELLQNTEIIEVKKPEAQEASSTKPIVNNTIPTVNGYGQALKSPFVTTSSQAIPTAKVEIPIPKEEIPLEFEEEKLSTTEEDVKETIDLQEEILVEEEKPTPILKSESLPEQPIEQEWVDWKPMSFEVKTPDALIGKPKTEEVIETKEEAQAIVVEEGSALSNTEEFAESIETEVVNFSLVEEPVAEVAIVDTVEETPLVSEDIQETSEDEVEERPVIELSFFDTKKEEQPKPESSQTTAKSSSEEHSNVPLFINTWNSWLQKEKPKDIKMEDRKTEIIDKFIETNPKISRLNEEKEYEVRDKGDDISHLMTETLAKLYMEQKLYAKAIKAYQALKIKYPDKAKDFDKKIEEVKELRSGK